MPGQGSRTRRRRERDVLALAVLSVIKTRPALIRAVAEAMEEETRLVEAATRDARRILAKLRGDAEGRTQNHMEVW